MRRTKWLLWLVSFTVLALVLTGCGDNDENAQGEKEDQVGEGAEDIDTPEPLDTSSDEVIATYDGLTKGEVTEGEFNLSLNVRSVIDQQVAMLMNHPEFKEQLLTQYIAEKSISSDVEQTEELKNEAEKMVDVFKQQLELSLPEGQDFAAFAEERGFSEQDLHDFVLNNIKVGEYFERMIDDKDLKENYDALKKDKDLRLYMAKVRHILIQISEEQDEEEAKKRAEEIKKKLDEGGDFAALAEKYSDDGSKENGGLLGDEPQPLFGYVTSFAETARDLPLNEISDPVQSEFGYHIIKVEEREILSFDEAKDIVQGDAVSKKYQHYVENELEIDTKKS